MVSMLKRISVRHHIDSIVISQIVTEIWWFFSWSVWWPSPSWIFNISKF